VRKITQLAPTIVRIFAHCRDAEFAGVELKLKKDKYY
jgi:hypothetical protein